MLQGLLNFVNLVLQRMINPEESILIVALSTTQIFLTIENFDFSG